MDMTDQSRPDLAPNTTGEHLILCCQAQRSISHGIIGRRSHGFIHFERGRLIESRRHMGIGGHGVGLG
jgi:hypothetical protein